MSDAYDQEQRALRQKQGLEEEEGEGLTDVPQGLPEVNPEIFRDVEPILFKGFVYSPAVINGVSFVFKSLNHHEFEYLNMIGGLYGKNQKAGHKNFDTFLALGVLMIDGTNVLLNREETLPTITELFSEFAGAARNKLIFELSEINRRANRAVILCEAFALEPQSRLRWAQFQGLNMASTAVSGFQGTEVLGLNWGQLTWRAINLFEDKKELAEREWENTKFLASATAGKGVSKIYAQDRRRRQTERDETLARRDRILRFALLNETSPSKSREGVIAARTVEELATQLERDLKGEKDWHDMVVDRYYEQSLQDRERRFELLQSQQEASREAFGGRDVFSPARNLQGLTPAEMQRHMQQRREQIAARLSQQAHPEFTDPKMGQFMDKWASMHQGGPPLTADQLKGLPFRRDRGE